MAQRYDFYFRQKVTEAELDAAFDGLEQADFNQIIDADLVGIFSGLDVSEASVPDLTVDVVAGTAYSKQGERIRVGSTQNVDVSQDENSTSTNVVGASNSRVISVFIEFDRTLSDPRTDGNSSTVQFNRAETFNIVVRQGSEATTPGGGSEESFIGSNGPALDSGLILLCDIIRDFGQTTITNSDIYTFRREDTFSITAGAIEVTAGTVEELGQGLLTELNNHVTGVSNAHDADVIDYDSTSIVAGWTDLKAATTVQDAIDGIETDLAQTDAPTLIGANVTQTWADSTSISGATVAAALNEIVSDLAGTGGGVSGAQKIGYDGAIGITSTTVADALDELASEKADKATTQTFTAKQRFQTHADGTWQVNSQAMLGATFASTGSVANSGSTNLIIEIGDEAGSSTDSLAIDDGEVAVITLDIVCSYTENSSDYDEYFAKAVYRVWNVGGTFTTDLVGSPIQETVNGASFITFTLGTGAGSSNAQAQLNLNHAGGGSGGDYRASGHISGIQLERP